MISSLDGLLDLPGNPLGVARWHREERSLAPAHLSPSKVVL